MDIDHIQSGAPSLKSATDQKKKEWAEEHAKRLQGLFEQWQKPLGINGQEFCRYSKDELSECYEDPILRSLIESIA
jgi:phage host-nuclease inhibitor protein Gam